MKPERKYLIQELIELLLRNGAGYVSPRLKETVSGYVPGPRKQIRGLDDWIAFSEAVRKRREGITEHEVADLEVRNLLETQNFGRTWDSASWFIAVQMVQAVGLFVISLELHRRGLAKFGLEVGRLRGIRKSLGLAQLAIQTGDSNLAANCQSQLARSALTPLAQPAKAVAEYLGAWLDGEHGGYSGFLHPSEMFLSSIVKGKNVLLKGPAVIRESKDWEQTNTVIVGIMRPTGPSAVSAGKFESGFPHVAYANGNTVNFLSRLDEAAIRNSLAPFSALVLKAPVPTVLQRNSATPIRRVTGGNQLLLVYGRPNMVQVAALDILRFAPSGLFITGVNFFIDDYREEERWYDHVRSRRVDIVNSGGEDFEVCVSISEHGAITNRNLLKNLQMWNRLDGDATFQDSLRLSDEEYLRALEIRFGKERV